MNQKARLQKAPKSTDLEGWRQAISQGSLPTFRLEDLVAALQDLGPLTDPHVRNPLAKHLSNAMTGLLRRLVGPNHPNQGDDIIYRVHGQLFEALVKPGSADGKGLRQAFTARVSFRVKDAIALEYQHSRISVVQRTWKPEIFPGPLPPIAPRCALECASASSNGTQVNFPRISRH